MVLVAVGQNNGPQSLLVLPHVGEVRNDDVHAQQFGVREHDPAIDDDHVAAVFVGHHVHPEFAHAAEWYDP